MTAQANSMWASRVRSQLRQGWGVEDIALIEQCDVEDVRREVKILRESGELEVIYANSQHAQ